MSVRHHCGKQRLNWGSPHCAEKLRAAVLRVIEDLGGDDESRRREIIDAMFAELSGRVVTTL